MTDFQPIGGYFELAKLNPVQNSCRHEGSLALSTGRGCISLILKVTEVKRCHVPAYCCQAFFEPFKDAGVELIYYNINSDFAPMNLPDRLADDELIFYVDYFGINRKIAGDLVARFGQQLALDNSHAFFEPHNVDCWTFTSARKQFGIADGAYLTGPVPKYLEPTETFDTDYTAQLLRSAGEIKTGFEAFRAYEAKLDSEIYWMSQTSRLLMQHVDTSTCGEQRQQNFDFLHQHLPATNQLKLPDRAGEIPFCYPYIPENPTTHTQLHERGIFVPVLWQDALVEPDKLNVFETSLCKSMLPLPIDQRYGEKEMVRILEVLNEISSLN